ncbi:MAG: DUF3857 domain-containing protein [Christiangramia sp.]|uniref:DUF3857 domain-containing protein n=1 Tax=Christiangramia sp. TaxID=1931228 RepID=UPI003242C684
MNRYFYSILFLVIASVSFAQSNKEDNVRELFWGPDDPVKNVMEIPEKWQGESAVVIYKFEDYTYNKFISKMTTTKSVRQRIKLLDQAAVEEFSEFSFTNRFKSSNWIGNLMAGEKHIVGVKVIKPDGSENVINVAEESVEVDGETKLAIANLEIGDIIDYYSYIEDLQPVMGTIEIYDPVEETLAEVYPVMNYRLQLLTDNKFYLNFRSFNGAPELKEIDNNKNSKRLFVLEAQDIAKRDFPNWYYPLVELPSVKFQVYYAVNNKNADYAMAFISEDEDIVKKEVSREEILNLYDTRFRPAGNYGEVEDYLKAHEYASDAEMVQDAYYFMRHYFFTRYIEASLVQDSKISNDAFKYYSRGSTIIDSQKRFVQMFTALLKEFDIDYEIVVGKNRFDGSLEDILIEQNVKTLLKVKTEPPVYIEYFDPHSVAGSFSPHLDGTDIYLLSSQKRKKIDQIDLAKLPATTVADNVSEANMSVSLNQDFSGMSVSSVNRFFGHEKTEEQKDRLYFADYVYEDYDRFQTERYLDMVKNKEKDQFQKELNSLSDKIRERQKEHFQERLSRAFDLEGIENYDYQINKTGRYGFTEAFEFSEEYDIENALIKKAGPNYILEIGRLIGQQISLNAKQRDRKENIYMAYPKRLKNSIRFQIPEGFVVEGLEKLNVSTENETGAFISQATVEGNELVINTTKEYRHNYEPNANWGKMMEFLDEADNFYNAKILLKKQ